MRGLAVALSFHLACGALSGVMVARLAAPSLGELPLLDQPFRLVRPAHDPVEVVPERWLLLPYVIPDFDLVATVELAAGSEADLLLRQVEPRVIGSELLPFQGRFTALRLSTGAAGPGWLSRDAALFGPRGSGVPLAPGHPATVSIEARGRWLRANVAGQQLPWHEADDVQGMLTMLVRGGKLVVHDLLITPRGLHRPELQAAVTWAVLGALAAALAAALALADGQRVAWFAAAGLVSVLLGSLAARCGDLELCAPRPAALLLALAGVHLAPLAGLRGRPVWSAVLAAVLAAGLLALADRQLRHDTTAVDAVFGPDAGNQLSEALGQLVRGPAGLHSLAAPRPRVFLLGGQLLYDRGAPGEHVELLLARHLRAALGKPVAVPCLPTVDGHPAQQWRLFERFFADFRPEAIVLGVGRGATAFAPERSGPRTTAADLAAVLDAAADHCRRHGAALVLFAEHDVDDRLLAVLRAAAQRGAPLVVAAADDGPEAIARQLAQALVPQLR